MALTHDDEKYMKRCLELAKLGEGYVAPNPMVGCVIVYNGKIIGEGFHRVYGQAHAEVNAINSVENHDVLQQATLYVNLEPCAHYGKTPPCAELIIRKKIQRVVVGTIDLFAKVSGKGIKMMQQAGIEVTVGVLHKQCTELNRRFFTFHQKKRPYIILKWAQTADGFVDVDSKQKNKGYPTWITNEIARIAVHKQRATESAILVGTNTALADNPSLTLREWYGKQPLRIVPDRSLRLPASFHVFSDLAPTAIIAPCEYTDNRHVDNIALDNEQSETINPLLQYLHSKNYQSLIVEGGPRVLKTFIDMDLWDEAHVYTGNIYFEKGIKAPYFQKQAHSIENIGNSILKIYRNSANI